MAVPFDLDSLLLLAQAAAKPPWWSSPVLILLGLFLLGMGAYVIKTRRVQTWHRRWFFGPGVTQEITGRRAVVRGVVMCIVGIIMLLSGLIGTIWF